MLGHRITNSIRCAAHSGGSRVSQNRVRAVPSARFCLHPHCGQGTFASQSPIACPKLRQPRTLCASYSKLLE